MSKTMTLEQNLAVRIMAFERVGKTNYFRAGSIEVAADVLRGKQTTREQLVAMQADLAELHSKAERATTEMDFLSQVELAGKIIAYSYNLVDSYIA